MPSMHGDIAARVSEEWFVLAAEPLADLAARLARTRLPADLGSGWEQGGISDGTLP